MKRPGYNLTWPAIRLRWSTSTDCSKHSNGIPIHHIYGNNTSSRSSLNGKINSTPLITISNTPLPKMAHSYETEMITTELRHIGSQLNFIRAHFWRAEKHEGESQDWRFVAMVIDRLCLIFFILCMITFSILVFLSLLNSYSQQ